MTLRDDFELIKRAKAELINTESDLREALSAWRLASMEMHKAEINVHNAHRAVARAINMFRASYSNGLSEELDRLTSGRK